MTNQEWDDCNELSDLRSENKALKEQLAAALAENTKLAEQVQANRRAQQPNEPLTLDELRKMDKSPVFSQHCGWGIVGFRKVGTGEQEHSKRYTVGFSYGWEWLDDVMRTGPLYRRPPDPTP